MAATRAAALLGLLLARAHGRAALPPVADATPLVQFAVTFTKGSPPAALEVPSPVSWVHFPKTGSSFINSLIRLPGACQLPQDFIVDRNLSSCCFLGAFQPRLKQSCPGLDPHVGHRAAASHANLANGSQPLMAMFRDPVQRLQSAYQDLQDVARGGWQEKLNRPWNWTSRCASHGWPNKTLPSFGEFVQSSRGCMVKMLGRDRGCVCGVSGGTPTEEDVQKAHQRLRENFAFVGITSRWRLSVCLLDRMFNTGCHRHQFVNTRAHGSFKPLALGLSDPWDGPLFREAKQIFEENLRRFGVTEGSCLPCYRQAGLK